MVHRVRRFAMAKGVKALSFNFAWDEKMRYILTEYGDFLFSDVSRLFRKPEASLYQSEGIS